VTATVTSVEWPSRFGIRRVSDPGVFATAGTGPGGRLLAPAALVVFITVVSEVMLFEALAIQSRHDSRLEVHVTVLGELDLHPPAVRPC
jgi:hypothetical protein